jgi:hypothetical protein
MSRVRPPPARGGASGIKRGKRRWAKPASGTLAQILTKRRTSLPCRKWRPLHPRGQPAAASAAQVFLRCTRDPISASYNGSQARSIACEPVIPHSWNSGGGCRVSHNHPDLVACPARGRGCRWRHEAAHRVGAMKAPPLVAAWCHSAAYDTPSEAALRRDGSRGRGGLTRAALARLSENQSKRKSRAGDGARAWRFNPVPSPA